MSGVPPRTVAGEVLHWLRIAPATIDDLRLMVREAGGSRRVIEEAVETLRLRGEPIVGYVLARRRRAVSIYLGTRALRRTAARLREMRDAEAGLTLFGDIAA
jgi:hypothetical protein